MSLSKNMKSSRVFLTSRLRFPLWGIGDDKWTLFRDETFNRCAIWDTSRPFKLIMFWFHPISTHNFPRSFSSNKMFERQKSENVDVRLFLESEQVDKNKNKHNFFQNFIYQQNNLRASNLLPSKPSRLGSDAPFTVTIGNRRRCRRRRCRL